MKKISILGSTGSIGTQTLDVVRQRGGFEVAALAAYKNAELMEKQAREFMPRAVALYDEKVAEDLKIRLKDTNISVFSGENGINEVAAGYNADMVIAAMVGNMGIKPTLCAIESGADIGLANKETMVSAGDIVNAAAKKHGVNIIPVDSEHSAIFQSIDSHREFLKKIYLTASGGPFFGKKREELENVTVEDALKHPNWSMGLKVTIDSATLINKGLEVIEAVRLFGVSPEQIEVLVHRQSIVHSMVEFCDNAVIAQLGTADMRLPIAYALSYPERMQAVSESVDFASIRTLTFEKPDLEAFYGLQLGIDAIKTGGTMPTVYCAAAEAAVNLFVDGKCRFTEIADKVQEAMAGHSIVKNPDLDTIIQTDCWARSIINK